MKEEIGVSTIRKGRRLRPGELHTQIFGEAIADFFCNDYDGGAAYVVLAHLSEQNNHPEVARAAAEHALGKRRTLLRNRVILALQTEPTEPIRL